MNVISKDRETVGLKHITADMYSYCCTFHVVHEHLDYKHPFWLLIFKNRHRCYAYVSQLYLCWRASYLLVSSSS